MGLDMTTPSEDYEAKLWRILTCPLHSDRAPSVMEVQADKFKEAMKRQAQLAYEHAARSKPTWDNWFGQVEIYSPLLPKAGEPPRVDVDPGRVGLKGYSGEIPLVSIEYVKSLCKAQAIKPKVVDSQRQADSLNQTDPAGHEWKVGDEYFEVRM